jgi:wyosine [tRNA(Phe)-imidazoG37] synthetase (radical SAM superfamily)
MRRNLAIQSFKSLPLQSGIIYGPVHSRRLGLSLGINLLPSGYKLCSFNCLYCQYGWTYKPTLNVNQHVKDLPRPEEISDALKRSLQDMIRRGTKVDCITFAGNGEPTLHPELAEIIDRTRLFRDKYVPQAKLAILSNSSTVNKEEVRDALEMLDMRVMKLDAGSEELMRHLNKPAPPLYLGEIVDGLKKLKDVILQSLFVQGRLTNTDPNSVEHWVQMVKEVQPILVQVYTLDRLPAERRLWKVNIPTLQWIASQVRWHAGVRAEVF